MNSFEQYTLIIGLLAVFFEGLRHLRAMLQNWLHNQHKAGHIKP
jgi:hypothetical protein